MLKTGGIKKILSSHQLGRRNLSPIQRIAVTEKYRPIYEKQAKENQVKAGIEYGNGGTKLTVNLPQASKKETRNPTTSEKLADIAGVSEKTYRMGAKVLSSDNEELKQRVLSGEYVKLCGYRNGGDRKSDSHYGNVKLSLEEIAKQLGTSKTNLTRAVSIERNLTESMKQLLDDGVISKTVQQRKLENVLKSWKDCMGSSMVGIENQVQIILT